MNGAVGVRVLRGSDGGCGGGNDGRGLDEVTHARLRVLLLILYKNLALQSGGGRQRATGLKLIGRETGCFNAESKDAKLSNSKKKG